MTLHENEHIIIIVHTLTAIFLKHLANTSFMASFKAWAESHSGHSPWACILLPCPTRYFAVYYSGLGFIPNAFLLSGRLLTNVQVNNTTTLHDICAHMYIHHIGITILLFFLHIFHSSLLTRSEIYNPRNPLASPRSQIWNINSKNGYLERMLTGQRIICFHLDLYIWKKTYSRIRL